MAKVRRATFFFPALEVTSVQNTQTGNTNQAANQRIWVTDFPLVYDPLLVVIRPPESIEELKELQQLPQNTPLDANGTPNRTGRYSSSQYFIGVALNNIIIHDGVFKKVDGITAEFVTNPQASNPNSLPQVRGVVTVDTTKIDFGVLDLVQIVVMKANTYSPWLYYGKIPERAALARKDNRFIASQGAIYPLDESEIIQAVGMRYFVDVFKSQISGRTLNFYQSMFGGFNAFDVNSSTSDIFFMGDVLDGDGILGYRSFTTFKILEIQETVEFGGAEAPTLNQSQRADAFKTVDYKSLEYQKTTNKIKKSIFETNYYFITDTDEKIVPYYGIVSRGFPLVSEFVNFETTKMSVGLQSISNDPIVIAGQLGAITASPMTLGGSITLAGDIIRNDTDTNRKVCVVFSDLISELDAGDAEINNLKASINQFPTTGSLKIALFITDVAKKSAAVQLANEAFGKSNVILIENQNISSLGALSFTGILMKAVGTSVAENNLIEVENGFNANTIVDNCKRITQPSGLSSGTDYDRDGILSLIDLRHYELTTRYKPTATQNSITTFLGDVGSEMRFWRKISPIGQLFNVTGTIESTEYIAGGNLMLTVKVKWTGPAEEEPENNSLKILVEYGAKTNLGDLNGEIEFQGRMFLPSYIVKTSMNNIINFSKVGDVSSWFRIFTSTAQQIINFGKNEANKDVPLLVIRSNAASSSGQGGGAISPIFSSPTATQGLTSSMSIVSGPEEIGDYLNLAGNDSRILLTTETPAPVDQPIDIYDSGSVDVVFSSIEFEIVLPAEEQPPSTENEDGAGLAGDFQYELQYKAQGVAQQNGQDVFNVLDKFYSVVVFDGDIVNENDEEKRIAKIVVSPNSTKSLLCNPTEEDAALAQDDPEKGKSFNITYNYMKNNEDKDYVWTWNPTEWIFTIKKNNKALINSDFETQPDPTTGSFKLKNKVNLQEDVIVAEFKNVAANQISLKIGSKLRLKATSGPTSSTVPKFRNLKINFTTEKSIERVECHYSSTLQGDSFYLTTPANGFVSLSGYGWAFESTNAAGSGFVDTTRINGNLTGPTLYIDAFSDSIEEKTISKSSLDPRFFPTVDIVFSNAVNTLGIPFMEILAILFDLPPPPDIERFSSTRSRITDRLTLVYNTENFLQQKYSFVNFSDRDTTDGWDFMQTSLRKNIPIYSETFSDSELTFSTSGNDIIIDVDNPELAANQGDNTNQSLNADKILVAIEVEYPPPNGNNPITSDDVVSYELYGSIDGGSYTKFGYTNSNGDSSSLVIQVKNKAKTFFQIPDTTLKGYTKLKLTQISSGSLSSPTKIVGSFIGAYTIGRSPAIFETNFGEYVLFFVKDITSISQKQILSLVSLQDGQTWQRPAVSKTITVNAVNDQGVQTTSEQPNPKFEVPVIILTGYSSPVLLKSNIADTFYIFVFNSRVLPGTIEMVEMERSLFFKLEEDNTSSASDINVETPDESQTSLMNTDEVISYARFFKANNSGGFNHVKTVLKKATAIFTVELLKSGDLYCALIDSSSQFRLKYNRALGGGFIDTSFNWEDLGVNLLDTTTDNGDNTKGSYLGKVVNNSNIGALTLRYSPIEDILWLFIATSTSAALNPGRLFLMRLPETVIKPPALKTVANDNQTHVFWGQELTDTQVDQEFQKIINKIKPILVYGKKEGLNPDFVEINSNGTADDFPTQIIATEWLDTGNGQIYFTKDNSITSRITKTSGIHWEDYVNI